MTTAQKTSKGFHYGYLIVLSCIVITCVPVALCLSCAGIFFTPVSSYFDSPRAAFALYFSIQNIAMAVMSPIAGKLVNKFDVRIVFSAAVALIGCSFLTMSFFTAIWQFYITGALLGIGIAPLVYLATPYLINAWFAVRNGFFVGLCMAFTGIGGIIFNPIGTMIIQSAPDGWRTAYLLFGGMTLVAALPFTLFVVRKHPQDMGLQPVGAEQVSNGQNQAENAPAADVDEGLTADQAMKTPSFYATAAFAFFIVLCMQAYQYLPSYCTSFQATLPQIAALSGVIASASMAGQAIGKVVLGIINDKSSKAGLLFGVVSGVIGVSLMCFLPSQAIILLIGAFLFGFEYASNNVQVPMLTRSIFGPRDYPNIYSRVAAVGTVGGVVGPILYGVVVDMPGGFNIMFALSGSCMIIAFLLGMLGLSQAKNLRANRER